MVAKSIATNYTNIHKPTDYMACSSNHFTVDQPFLTRHASMLLYCWFWFHLLQTTIAIVD